MYHCNHQYLVFLINYIYTLLSEETITMLALRVQHWLYIIYCSWV